MLRLALVFLMALTAACRSKGDAPLVQVAAEARALDESTVEIVFTHPIDAARFDPAVVSIAAPFARPAADLAVQDVSVDGATLLVTTSAQDGGVLYAVALGDVPFTDLEDVDAPSQVNFRGFGMADVVITLSTDGFMAPSSLEALVTIDVASGEYTPALQRVPMTATSSSTFSATVRARIDPDRRHAVRAITGEGAEAGQLATFTVGSADAVFVGLTPLLERLPEFDAPVDTNPGDGFAPVRLVFDDRPARGLARPSVRMSIDGSGAFDAGSTRIDPLTVVAGETRVYETVVEVAVDAARTLDGTTADTFPYVVFLVENGEDIPQRGTTFVMPEERPQVIVIPIGNPAMVPVTFRVDVGSSFVNADGSVRGMYPGEGVFLTGELPSAEDALGRLAADAFTGGERATLEMNERPDAAGVYEKTIFLPPNRPYGWKVVRCPTGRGCAELNRHVVSSGRAFPTVMKNLVSENQDAARVATVEVIDPANLGDFAGATVSLDGTEGPSNAILFKQEAPDLVVTVGTEPVVTDIVVVGTWRDVNIPDTPEEIITAGGTLDLSPFDYDDGTQGRDPPLRDLDLPLDPPPPSQNPGEPAFSAGDGRLDGAATSLLGGTLHVAYNEEVLYVATEPAAPGVDRFVVVAFSEPAGTRAAMWAKSGQIGAGANQAFLAMEGDGDFGSWFSWGAAPNDDAQLMAGTVVGRGTVLEGTIDPTAAGVGAFGGSVWIAVLSYGTDDGGELSAQSPSGNMNLDVEASEFVEVPLTSVR